MDAADRMFFKTEFVTSTQTQAIPKAKIRMAIQGVPAMGRPSCGMASDFKRMASMNAGMPEANKINASATLIEPMTTLALRFLIIFFGAV